jgi:hypothetical protein
MERDDWEKLSPDAPLRPLAHDSDRERATGTSRSSSGSRASW